MCLIYTLFPVNKELLVGKKNLTTRQRFCISYFLFSKLNVHSIDESK